MKNEIADKAADEYLRLLGSAPARLCGNCRFWWEGQCKRDPQSLPKAKDDWCGGFRHDPDYESRLQLFAIMKECRIL